MFSFICYHPLFLELESDRANICVLHHPLIFSCQSLRAKSFYKSESRYPGCEALYYLQGEDHLKL